MPAIAGTAHPEAPAACRARAIEVGQLNCSNAVLGAVRATAPAALRVPASQKRGRSMLERLGLQVTK